MLWAAVLQNDFVVRENRDCRASRRAWLQKNRWGAGFPRSEHRQRSAADGQPQKNAAPPQAAVLG
jgi:hypothetical protein